MVQFRRLKIDFYADLWHQDMYNTSFSMQAHLQYYFFKNWSLLLQGGSRHAAMFWDGQYSLA